MNRTLPKNSDQLVIESFAALCHQLETELRNARADRDTFKQLLIESIETTRNLTAKNGRLSFALRTLSRETQDFLKAAS